jgi:hypothetical protein
VLGTATSVGVTPVGTQLSSGLSLGKQTGVFKGTQSFAGVFSTALTPTQVSSFYSLYKSTLGVGLGLS